MKQFIELPNGEVIKKDAILAVRLGDADPKWNLEPRVIVDFTGGTYTNSCIVNCQTVEARNDLAAFIKSRLL